MTRKDTEYELFLAIEHAIDAYIEFGGKCWLETRQDLEHGYEVKLSIRKMEL